MDSLSIKPSELVLRMDEEPPVDTSPPENSPDHPEESGITEMAEPDESSNSVISDIPADMPQSNDSQFPEDFGDAELKGMKGYLENIDDSRPVGREPSNITTDEVANIISVRITRPQTLSEELLNVIDGLFGTITINDRSLRRLVEQAGSLTDKVPPSPARTPSSAPSKIPSGENEFARFCEVIEPMVAKLENEELLAADLPEAEATEPKFENEESMVSEQIPVEEPTEPNFEAEESEVSELVEKPMEPSSNSEEQEISMEPNSEIEEQGISEITEPLELEDTEVGEMTEKPIMSEEFEHEESAISQPHSNPVLEDILASPSTSQSNIATIPESGETEWKDLKGIIEDIEKSSADGQNPNMTVEKIASIISTKYVEFLETEWQRRRNIWLKGAKQSGNEDDYENSNSAYAYATFGDYVSSQHAQLQIPFDLPEIEIGGDKKNPVL